jgi:hypothetical protein
LTTEEYRKAVATVLRAARAEGLDAVLRGHQLDCVVGPTLPLPAPVSDPINGDALPDSPALFSYAAMAGYPSVTLPIGFIFGFACRTVHRRSGMERTDAHQVGLRDRAGHEGTHATAVPCDSRSRR